MILEHATPKKNLEKILREGLLPRWMWSWRSDIRQYVHDPVHLSDGTTTLPSDIGDLHDADEVAVLAVELTMEQALNLRVGYDGLGTYMLFDWIRPEQIRVLRIEKRPEGGW